MLYSIKNPRYDNRPITRRFISDNVEIDPVTKCWNWTGAIHHVGYGVMRIPGRSAVSVHRVSFQLWKGIPKHRCVCHTCDNRKCCNPKHLFSGSHRDNTKDSIRKGRWPVGERSSQSKLTRRQVELIRLSKFSDVKLAAKYKVTDSTIWKARKRWTYK